jgi:hypothetical protein
MGSADNSSEKDFYANETKEPFYLILSGQLS